jgi:hypothetical protein
MLRSPRPHFASRRLFRAGLLSVSALVAGLSVLAPAKAQTMSPLRGEITEEEASEDLVLRRRPTRQQPQGAAQTANPREEAKTPAGQRGQTNSEAKPGQSGQRQTSSQTPTEYEPTSLGGLTEAEEEAARPEQDENALLADDPTLRPREPNDPFAESPPIPQPRPSSRERRADNADKQEQSVKNQPRDANRRTRQGPQTAADRNRPEGEETEDELTTGTTRLPTVDSDEREDRILDRGAERERAIEGLEREPDDKPFEAVGVRVGTFILRPSFEQGVTYTTNANSSPQGAEAVLSESTLRLNAVSDWSQHKATLDAFGIFRKSVSGEDVQQVEGGISGTLDYDLSREFKLKSALGYAVKPESASSPVDLGNVVDQPLRHTFNGSLGLSKELGKLELGVTGKAERNIYGDADLEGGGTLTQDDRNSTLATIALRGGYEISPAITPFAELEVGRRFYDEKVDGGGYERSANRLAARAGVAVDIEEKLTGEFSAGWLRESFDDERLDAISGLSLNADLRWSPERATTIGLNASTTVEGTTAPGESGSLLHSGRLTLERQIRSNLTANATLGADWRTYNGTGDHDLLLSGELGATWWLNRYLGLTGRVKHEQQKSDLPGRDYKSDSVFLGVKVQR